MLILNFAYIDAQLEKEDVFVSTRNCSMDRPCVGTGISHSVSDLVALSIEILSGPQIVRVQATGSRKL
jgi:hypothetical protein